MARTPGSLAASRALNLVAAALVAGLGLRGVFAGDPVPSPPREDAPVSELLRKLAEAGPADRPALVHRLALAGPDALAETRRARDAAPEGDLRRALERAATWQLARRISPRLLEGFETQLTFAGQFLSLDDEGPEVASALLALLSDEATDVRIRLTACRGLADVVDPRLDHASRGGVIPAEVRASIRESLRKLYHDILLPAIIREQAGLILAILGDMRAVDTELERLVRLAASPEQVESVQSHLQLANLYYRIREYDKALASYETVLRFYELVLSAQTAAEDADATATAQLEKELAVEYYNAACSSSLAGKVPRAKEYLRKAVRLNASHFENVEKDGDFVNLRRDPGYEEFRKELEKLAR